MNHHAELVKSIRSSGHRLTPQRESVLSVVAETQGHITAEEILARVRERYPYLNKSAIYRSLDLLTEIGLVTVTDMGHGSVEYEMYRDPKHHHLICHTCKTVTQLDHALLEPLSRKIESQYGFAPELQHFAIFGTCRKCQLKQSRLKQNS